ncbi:MAG: DUF3990 domain-containing protein [Treponema sp.]|nr:DUF3990 domain-containing protein [Treponema sp.]
MILYHGSNIEIEKVELSKCKPFKDFGCAFYTTPSREQALSMAKRTVRIYGEGKPIITEFTFDDSIFDLSTKDPTTGMFNVKVKQLKEPTADWARFVINNRNPRFTGAPNQENNADSKYDIVIGPVANDDITALIDVYLSGILSDEALTKELTFRELSMQFSFHTEKSIKHLLKTGVFYG